MVKSLFTIFPMMSLSLRSLASSGETLSGISRLNIIIFIDGNIRKGTIFCVPGLGPSLFWLGYLCCKTLFIMCCPCLTYHSAEPYCLLNHSTQHPKCIFVVLMYLMYPNFWWFGANRTISLLHFCSISGNKPSHFLLSIPISWLKSIKFMSAFYSDFQDLIVRWLKLLYFHIIPLQAAPTPKAQYV